MSGTTSWTVNSYLDVNRGNRSQCTYEYEPAGRLVAIRDAANAANNEYFVYRNSTEPVAWMRGAGATAVHQYYAYGTQPHVPDLIYVDNDADVEINAVYRVIYASGGSWNSAASSPWHTYNPFEWGPNQPTPVPWALPWALR